MGDDFDSVKHVQPHDYSSNLLLDPCTLFSHHLFLRSQVFLLALNLQMTKDLFWFCLWDMTIFPVHKILVLITNLFLHHLIALIKSVLTFFGWKAKSPFAGGNHGRLYSSPGNTSACWEWSDCLQSANCVEHYSSYLISSVLIFLSYPAVFITIQGAG